MIKKLIYKYKRYKQAKETTESDHEYAQYKEWYYKTYLKDKAIESVNNQTKESTKSLKRSK